jgi:tRNA uridine 5-carboxymethylaminomethyl modification enzyme
LTQARTDLRTPAALAREGIHVKQDGQPRGVLDLFGHDATPGMLPRLFPWLQTLTPQVVSQLEVEALYGGYLARQEAEARQLRATEALQLPEGLNYDLIRGLSTEARETLSAVRPQSIASMSRIPGINPPAVMAVLGHLRRLQA